MTNPILVAVALFATLAGCSTGDGYYHFPPAIDYSARNAQSLRDRAAHPELYDPLPLMPPDLGPSWVDCRSSFSSGTLLTSCW